MDCGKLDGHLFLGTMDEHWTPIMESCSVCAEDMRYDFIIKYEDLTREESYLVRRLGLENLIRPRWENKQSPENATTSQVSQQLKIRWHQHPCRTAWIIGILDFLME